MENGAGKVERGVFMGTLIINTLPEADERVQRALALFEKSREKVQIFHTRNMTVRPCIGCNFCWLKTPGVCAIKDDYEQILQSFMQHQEIVYITGTALGFMDHYGKNAVDRILPLLTMYIQIADQEMRHVMRYDKRWKLRLFYAGEADKDYMDQWMHRFAVNLMSDSMGAYPIEEVAACIS